MRFRFSLKTSITCAILIALMLWASAWQWRRHKEKLRYIEVMNSRLEQPIADMKDVLSSGDLGSAIHRRVNIEGRYDFKHEMILRNRRLGGRPGALVITPLEITGTDKRILVNRGFIPFSHMKQDDRKVFQREETAKFIGLLKESMKRKIFSPEDPPAGKDLPWLDAWLRVDVPRMAEQLPYPVLDIYTEIMGDPDPRNAANNIVDEHSGRDDMFFLPSKDTDLKSVSSPPVDLSQFPIPRCDTVAPPGRHLGYVFEWAFMALATLLIGIVLQLKRPKPQGALNQPKSSRNASS